MKYFHLRRVPHTLTDVQNFSRASHAQDMIWVLDNNA
jgi:hypothetical protein